MSRRKKPFNAFRNGKIHVCARMCATCIYRPDGLHTIGETDIVKRAAVADTAVICHSTLDTAAHAVCRGFYEHDATVTLHVAKAIGAIAWQEPQEKEKP